MYRTLQYPMSNNQFWRCRPQRSSKEKTLENPHRLSTAPAALEHRALNNAGGADEVEHSDDPWSWFLPSLVEKPLIRKADIVGRAITKNDVVEDRNAQELPGFIQAGSQRPVFLAGLRVA